MSLTIEQRVEIILLCGREGATNRFNSKHEAVNVSHTTDEANFYLNGEVNKQNCRYYASENPHWMQPTKEHGSAKLMVWCGQWRDHVLGPSFFDSMLDGNKYLRMLQEELIPQLNSIGEGWPE